MVHELERCVPNLRFRRGRLKVESQESQKTTTVCIGSRDSRIQCLICVTDAWPTSRTVVVRSSTLCTLTAMGGSHFKTTVRVSGSFHFPTQYECQWARRM